MNETLNYYDTNAEDFVKSTQNIDFSTIQDLFLSHLPADAKILDFGCGSGRDAAYFHSKGFMVDAVDGSAQLCRLAGEYSGITVKHMLFSELSAVGEYDGIWACSSILHLPSAELKDVMGKMLTALKKKGWIYTSFKHGEFEGVRGGRYFTDFTEKSFEKFIADMDGIYINKYWISGDVRPGRGDEKWLNLMLQKLDIH
ncbi:MAG: methyltransferase domain-containing protein [Lachnospiraceae bacterium]|nr:methyltransferase domain-containing protein [Lachnospiraceae bacterium]